jgi:2-dehydropantoate 2-reductase
VKRVVVLGAGGIGTAVGTILSSAGHDVTLVTRIAEDAERISRNGARVTGVVELNERPRSTAEAVQLGDDDVLLVAVKGHQTVGALERVHGVPGASLSLQNGIEKERLLIERFGKERVVASVVQVTASLESPGVSHCAAIEPSVVSTVDPVGAVKTEALARMFSDSGIPTSVVDDAEAIEWTKASQWLPSSLLTSATGLTLDAVLRDSSLARVYVTIIRECASVAGAHGVRLAAFGRLYAAELTEGTVEDATAKLAQLGKAMAASDLAGYRTAMELDLARGKPPELDTTAGAMQRAARAAGLECPALETMIAVVTARASARGAVGYGRR